jgi:hypothetical protein
MCTKGFVMYFILLENKQGKQKYIYIFVTVILI